MNKKGGLSVFEFIINIFVLSIVFTIIFTIVNSIAEDQIDEKNLRLILAENRIFLNTDCFAYNKEFILNDKELNDIQNNNLRYKLRFGSVDKSKINENRLKDCFDDKKIIDKNILSELKKDDGPANKLAIKIEYDTKTLYLNKEIYKNIAPIAFIAPDQYLSYKTYRLVNIIDEDKSKKTIMKTTLVKRR